MLVPEGRLEITTEGGLDVAGNRQHLADVVRRLNDGGIPVAGQFIDAEPEQVAAAAEWRLAVCEIHTGALAHAHASGTAPRSRPHWRPWPPPAVRSSRRACGSMRGTPSTTGTWLPSSALDGLDELHIGHSTVSRSIFTGFGAAVAEMHAIISHAEQTTDVTTTRSLNRAEC